MPLVVVEGQNYIYRWLDFLSFLVAKESSFPDMSVEPGYGNAWLINSPL